MTIYFDMQKEFPNGFGGLTRQDGSGSAETLREDFLSPLLKKIKNNEQIIINLGSDIDTDYLYASNFLREGFVGMVKHGYISKKDFLNIFKFTYQDESFAFYKNRIYLYLKELKDSEILNQYKLNQEKVSLS